MKKISFIPIIILLFSFRLMAQLSPAAPEHKPGELIVQLAPGADLSVVVAKLNRMPLTFASIQPKKTLVPDWRIHVLSFDESLVNPEELVLQCMRMEELQAAQLNNKAEDRSIEPNDPDWLQQSDMTLINAPEAWMTSTGGLTPHGDTIVVAVLEKGALYTHPDLAPNRFFNWHEVPGDQIDNDQNGYVDDFGGWNPADQTDNTGNNGAHGTGVCGIIGAKGNNAVGVTGVNWNVKLLNVSGVAFDDDIISAYRYVYDMRKLYNDSNKAKGAFIVATNASFGYNNVFPSSSTNFTVWCNLYDTLGTVGVLNVGATTNQQTDVDVMGDMPTSCGSEFLMTVTNVNKLGSWVPSGYGQSSIDLGAPGIATYSTSSNGVDTPGFGTIGGTSAATPHVTGALALLYSLGCDEFTADAISNPAACARRIRDVILNNTQAETTLKDITVTGGYLDLELAVKGVTELCAGAVGPLDILDVRSYSSNNEVRLYYQTPTFLPYNFRVFNMLGQLLYEEELHPDQFSENYVKFDTSNLPRGVYVYSISRGNAIVSVKFPKI